MKMFQNIQLAKRKMNKFNLSHEKKLSCKMGDLVPIYLEEVIPGDKFRVSSEIMMRLAPMLAPVMHRVNVYTHYFFVANRLIHEDWEDFITGGEDGQTVVNMPKLQISDTTAFYFQKGKLPDYFGIPITDGITVAENSQISALPFRAYQLIYNEYYRDQNLSNPIDVPKDSINMTSTVMEQLVTMRKRAWSKDYFTSALPWAQRGGEVYLPVESEFTPQYSDPAVAYRNGIGPATVGTVDSNNVGELSVDSNPVEIRNLQSTQSVDSTSVTINELRKAVKLQEWLERNARAGARYIEQILSHFGVKSSDSRLQRPEYLGGGKNPVVISEVLQTSGQQEVDGSVIDKTPQGNMSGHGISVGKTNRFQRSFEEHGWIIGIMSVLPEATYQQGINRHFTKWDKFDYYWPEFAHLGEQEILNKELYNDYTSTQQQNDETFGYQERYAEYKFKPSSVHGDFRDNLSYWHMGRIFDTAPVLNANFVTANPTKRIFAVEDADEDELYVQIYNNVSALRLIPYFGTPRL